MTPTQELLCLGNFGQEDSDSGSILDKLEYDETKGQLDTLRFLGQELTRTKGLLTRITMKKKVRWKMDHS